MTADDALAHFGMEPPPRYDVPPLTLDDEQVRAELRAAFTPPGKSEPTHEPTDVELRVGKIARQGAHFLNRPDDTRIEYLLRLVLTAEQVFQALDAVLPRPMQRPWHLIGAQDGTEVINRLLTSEAMRK